MRNTGSEALCEGGNRTLGVHKCPTGKISNSILYRPICYLLVLSGHRGWIHRLGHLPGS